MPSRSTSDVFGLLPPRRQGREDGEREIKFTFDVPGNRELPQIVGQLKVLPKHWWEGTDSAGPQARRLRDHARDAAGLGRLPHQGIRRRPIAHARARQGLLGQRSATSMSATNNFDELRFEYFRDDTVALEAFKADQVDWSHENSAKNWATAYDFPAVNDKRVVKEEFPNRSSGRMQAFAFNLRRDQVHGPTAAPRVQLRVRFRGDEQAAVLRPVQAHQQLFRRHRTGVDPACRKARNSKSWKPCATRCRRRCSPRPTPIRSAAIPRRCATICARRMRLLKEAGYEVRDRKLVNAKTGEPFTVEIPDRTIRATSASCCSTSRRWSGSASPSSPHRRRRAVREPAAQLGFRHRSSTSGASRCRPATSSAILGLASGRQPGSRNIVGIKNPAIDALIDG